MGDAGGVTWQNMPSSSASGGDLLQDELDFLWGNRSISTPMISGPVKGKRKRTEEIEDEAMEETEADQTAESAVEEAEAKKPTRSRKPNLPAAEDLDRKGQPTEEEKASRARNINIFGALGAGAAAGASGKKASGKASKEIAKSTAVSAEAGQLLQLFDDVDAIFKLSEGKVNTAIGKVTARLSDDVVSACFAEGDASEQGLSVVAELRDMRNQLQETIPLLSSLASASGDESFHPKFLESALKKARSAGVTVTPHIDELLAVRMISMLGENQQWQELVEKLVGGLQHLKSETQTAIKEKGIIHAVESLMRTSLPSDPKSDDQDPDGQSRKGQVAMERCKVLQELVKLIKQSDLPAAMATMESKAESKLMGDLSQLELLLSLVLSERGPASLSDEEVRGAESARTCLCAKSCSFQRALYALPLGVWLIETVQDTLAKYHSQKAVLAGVDSLPLGC